MQTQTARSVILRILFFATAILLGMLGGVAFAFAVFAIITGLPAAIVTTLGWAGLAVLWQNVTVKLAIKWGHWPAKS